MSLGIFTGFGALMSAFAAGLSPSVPVEYVGAPVSFTPPDEGEWFEVRTFWNGNENYAWDDDIPAIKQGFFKVGAVSRSGGLPEAQALADLVVAEFAKGTTFGGARVEKEPEQSSPLQEDDRLTVPVTIRWRTVG